MHHDDVPQPSKLFTKREPPFLPAHLKATEADGVVLPARQPSRCSCLGVYDALSFQDRDWTRLARGVQRDLRPIGCF